MLISRVKFIEQQISVNWRKMYSSESDITLKKFNFMLKARITFTITMFKSLIRLGDKRANGLKAGGFSSLILNLCFIM